MISRILNSGGTFPASVLEVVSDDDAEDTGMYVVVNGSWVLDSTVPVSLSA